MTVCLSKDMPWDFQINTTARLDQIFSSKLDSENDYTDDLRKVNSVADPKRCPKWLFQAFKTGNYKFELCGNQAWRDTMRNSQWLLWLSEGDIPPK